MYAVQLRKRKISIPQIFPLQSHTPPVSSAWHTETPATRQCGMLYEILACNILSNDELEFRLTSILASSPGHSQILSHSRGEIKSGSGLGTRLQLYYIAYQECIRTGGLSKSV